MTAPDKIWVEAREGGRLCVWDYDNGQTEYTRTDTIPTLLADARAEALREAAKICNENRDVSGWVSRDSILALIDAPPRPNLLCRRQPSST